MNHTLIERARELDKLRDDPKTYPDAQRELAGLVPRLAAALEIATKRETELLRIMWLDAKQAGLDIELLRSNSRSRRE
jgi:hypothetical protein